MTVSPAALRLRPWLQFALPGYAVAALSVGIVVVLKETATTQRALEATPLLLAAVGITTWFGGIGPGLAAMALAVAFVDYYFIPPFNALGLTLKDVPSVVMFGASALFFVWVSAALRASQQALWTGRDQLETRVLERTTELAHINEQLQAEIAERRRAEDDLRRQANLLEQTHDAIFVWEFSGTITYWNRGAEQLYGFSREAAIGRTGHALLRTEHPWPLADFEATIEREGRWTGELIHTTRDGRKIVVESRQVLIHEGGGRRLVLETNRDITERKQAEQALDDLAGRLINAQEEERSRIGRELHDHVSQRLGLLAIKIDQLRLNSIARDDGALDDLRQQTSEITDDIHGLSHRLHSSMLDHLGLVPALQRLVKECSQRYAIPIAFTHAPVPTAVPSELALCLFRVVEESLANIGKHSRASSARVDVWPDDRAIRLAVADDGIGFDSRRAKGSAGLGFVSMRERLRLVHGTIDVQSAPAEGTTINVRVPSM